MSLDDGLLSATEAQWNEHSAAWRYAHLELAPSAQYRQSAIEEHQRQELALQAPATGGHTPGEVWARLPLLGRQALLGSIVVVVLVVAVVLR